VCLVWLCCVRCHVIGLFLGFVAPAITITTADFGRFHSSFVPSIVPSVYFVCLGWVIIGSLIPLFFLYALPCRIPPPCSATSFKITAGTFRLEVKASSLLLSVSRGRF